ncbi:MAG: S-adenosylmethionine decarboxylase [Vampirovibrionales bacterium]
MMFSSLLTMAPQDILPVAMHPMSDTTAEGVLTVPTHVPSELVQVRPVQSEPFGPHLMLDCQQCNLEKISDVAYVFNFLNELPERIGMTKITTPYVFPYSGLVPEDKGITGVVIIAESHLTFHSFTEKDYFFFDIFSCKPFDVTPVIQEIIRSFDVGYYELGLVSRGRHFPRS